MPKILSTSHVAEFTAQFGTERRRKIVSDVYELAGLDTRMHLEIDWRDPYYEQAVSGATEKEVESWFKMEYDQGVQEMVSNNMFGEDGETMHLAEKDLNLERE